MAGCTYLNCGVVPVTETPETVVSGSAPMFHGKRCASATAMTSMTDTIYLLGFVPEVMLQKRLQGSSNFMAAAAALKAR